MLTKDKVRELVEHMPESFSVDDIVEEIFILNKVEKAREQVRNGQYITEDELDRDVNSWE